MGAEETTVGLRIDVDTMRGTRRGVPALLRLLERHKIKATFFFSVGPDNMGRHLWRLLRPVFFMKMLRSNGVSLYGLDILLRGTLWPGAVIGRHCADIIRDAAAAGHEIGLHAWDHHAWQMNVESMSAKKTVFHELKRAKDMLEQIIGEPVSSSAVPGWRCTDSVLLEKEKLQFFYNSDCRGESVFYPVVDGVQLEQLQIPVTLPTYDEVIGCNGISDANYNEHLLSQITSDRLNVLTIHAEAEGICCSDLFQDFLARAESQGVRFYPLSTLLAEGTSYPDSYVVQDKIKGREGWVSCQKSRKGQICDK